MPSTTTSLLAAVVLAAATLTKAHPHSHHAAAAAAAAPIYPRQTTTTTPTAFQPFDPSTFCHGNETTVTAKVAYAVYPVPPQKVYEIVGDFFNTSWIGVSVTKTLGPDNTPGSSRFVEGDPFVKQEILTYYSIDNQTFAHEQVVKTAGPVLLAQSGGQNYTETRSHISVQLEPLCDGASAGFGFHSTFCTTGNAPSTFDLAAMLYSGAEGALQRLWSVELGLPADSFGGGPTCGGSTS